MDAIVSLLTTLNSLSPLGLAALLGLIIFLQVKNQKAVIAVSDNHLSGLPDMAATLTRIEAALKDINDNTIFIRAKLTNGHSKN